jgi:branched-chain amino acid transport system ATP-binding protein
MLSVEDLHVYYGRACALRGVSLSIGDGSVTALLGANGAGKSTMLKTISGILHPRHGRILFDGSDISRLDPGGIVRRGIVHCPEGRQVFPGLSVRENLLLGSYAVGTHEQLDYVLELFPRLRDRLKQHAGTLSGGEQQMLAIGRALMGKPKLLMMDEPSLGLAPIIVEQIFDLFGGFRDRGISVLVVEQNAMLALEVADWVYTLSHGEPRISGAASELRDSDIIQRIYLS